MIYKFMKKDDNNEWFVTEEVDFYSTRFDELITSGLYIDRLLESSNRNAYFFKSDLNKIILNENEERYSRIYTQQQFDNLTQQELVSNLQLTRCEICGKIERLDYSIKVGRNHFYCGSTCASRVATKCATCGEWYLQRLSIANYTNDLNFGESICNKCFEKKKRTGMIRKCTDCRKYDYYSRGALVGGNFYCHTCKENHVIPQVIQGYHNTTRNWVYQCSAEENETQTPLLYFGHETEIETAEGADNNEVAYYLQKLHNENSLKYFYENDSSLEGRGFEIISMPSTLKWYYENAEKIKSWLQFLIDNGCKSHDTTTCGLHIHISRSYFNDINVIENRLGFLVEKLRVDLKKFARRKNFYWCNFTSNNQEEVTLQNVTDKKRNMQGHHSAINFQNANTIEFRIFKGTLKFETLMASIELVSNLANYVKNIQDDSELEYTTFEDIIKYQPTQYLINYCIDRKIIRGGDIKCA